MRGLAFVVLVVLVAPIQAQQIGVSERAAQARFEQAERALNRLRGARPLSEAPSKREVLGLIARRDAALAGYQSVMELDSELWTAAAGYRQGEILELFAQRLGEFGIVEPAGAQTAGDFEALALEAYLVARARAAQAGLRGEWSGKLAVAVERLRDDEEMRRVKRERAAQAAFEELMAGFEVLALIDFQTLEQKELKRRLDRLISLLSKFEKSAVALQAMGSDRWSVAALYILGKAYEMFGYRMENAPKPPGLENDVMYMNSYVGTRHFRFGSPLYDKAYEVFARAVQLANEGGVFTVWRARAVRAMARFERGERNDEID